MTLGVGRADPVGVLSGLSEDVVGALLDEDERRPSPGDPFAAALRRYHDEGHPLELTRAWRRASVASSAYQTDRAADVLRLLARDLLTCVSAPPAAAGSTPVAVDEPPPNVHPIDAPPAGVPSLELSGDGTWRPATSSAAPGEQIEVGHRPAYVPTLGSRYPDVSPAPAVYTSLPSSIVPTGAARTAPARPPEEKPTEDPPPPAPVAPGPQVGMSAESVIQAVSGGLELVAGPFDRFQQLAAFVKALRQLNGVQDVTTRQFVRGMVHLRVRYSDPIALVTRLEGMTEFAPEILSSSHSRIEIRVRLPDDVPPARG